MNSAIKGIGEIGPSILGTLGRRVFTVAGTAAMTTALVFYPENYGLPSSDQTHRPQPIMAPPPIPHSPIVVPSYHLPPKALPGFPTAEKIKTKTGRARWGLPNGSILEWDYRHGRVEKYNPRGQHQGEFDPNTGEQTKPGDPTRTTEN